MARGNGLKIGIALGAESAVAVVMGKKGAPIARVPVSLEGEASGFDVDIARGLATLKRQVEESGMGPTDGASVHVALLPPLADARLIPFPPCAARRWRRSWPGTWLVTSREPIAPES